MTPRFYYKRGELMTVNSIPYNVKQRLKRNSICPICKECVESLDDFQYVKTKSGRLTVYTFFHTNCLLNSNRKAAEHG